MDFIKKQAAGFYLNIVVIVIAVMGLIRYLQNCKTSYFSNLGTNHIVVVCFIVAICAEIIFLAGYEIIGNKIVFDVFPVIAAILLTIGTILFVSSRVNGIAAIMTFTNNASTMADLNHTIISIVVCAISMILTIIASFFKVVK